MAGKVLKRSSGVVYGFAALLLSLLLTIYFHDNYDWHPYYAWLGAASVSAFVLYGLDKVRADRKKGPIPRGVLNGLTLSGGFLGAWLGMFSFWHRVRQLSHWLLLTLSLVLHGGIAYFLFS